MGAFVDGYFLALQAQTDRFQISALENGLVWDALDVAQVSQTTGIVRAMVAVHREVWLLGTLDDDRVGRHRRPRLPLRADSRRASSQQGIGSLFGWAVVDNALYWHGQNEDGGRVGVRGAGLSAAAHLDARGRAGVGRGLDAAGHDLLELSGPRASLRRASTSRRPRRRGSMTSRRRRGTSARSGTRRRWCGRRTWRAVMRSRSTGTSSATGSSPAVYHLDADTLHRRAHRGGGGLMPPPTNITRGDRDRSLTAARRRVTLDVSEAAAPSYEVWYPLHGGGAATSCSAVCGRGDRRAPIMPRDVVSTGHARRARRLSRASASRQRADAAAGRRRARPTTSESRHDGAGRALDRRCTSRSTRGAERSRRRPARSPSTTTRAGFPLVILSPTTGARAADRDAVSRRARPATVLPDGRLALARRATPTTVSRSTTRR